MNNNITFYPLIHPQKRIWYIEKIYQGTSLYNIGGPVRIKGALDFIKLEESINILIKNNEGLRLRIIEENGEVKQYVSNYEMVKLDYIDFSKHENSEEEFDKWVEKVARKPFDIENDRLFYFAMFKISDNDNGYLAKFHHIISDGWSINIMTNYICNTYMKLLNGEEINDGREHSYIDYILDEDKYLVSDRFFKNKLFWTERFKSLPDAFLNKSSDFIEGKRKTFELEADVTSKIKKFCSDSKCSMNTFFVTLFLIYLYKTTQQEDIVIGTPVLNRSGRKEKAMFGMFTSTMPFRFVIDNNLNVMDTVSKVNEQLMKCYFNQKYPYDLLVQDLELKKNGYDNLFNTCVNYYNTKLNSELNGYPIKNVEFYNGNQIYSLQLVIKDWSDSGNLTLDFDYKVNDYSDEQINDIYTHLLSLANQIMMNPSGKLKSLSLLSNNERKELIYHFNATQAQYPKDKTIYQLFEEQVEKTPDKVAISFNNIELTYREINERANQLARYLVKKGLERENVVGLLTTRSIETVIGILGILKAGGAYLPIDPSYPSDRISYMLEDSGSRILLTNIQLPKNVGFNGIIIDLNNQDIYSGDSYNLECFNKTNDLVYVIYTSGFTGKPKGTMIEHQGLVNYIWWAKKMYVKNDNEIFPLYSSLSFDLTVTSIFTPLISGSKIIVYDESNDDDEYVLYRIIKENKATIIKLTPSHLSLLKNINNKNTSLKRFIVGGEDLKVSLAKDIYESFSGNVEIFNEYGPTETVVGCMIHKYNYESDTRISVPIGVPADNVQIYILDKELNPVSSNTIGEIFISSDGVAKGYLNMPQLTEEKFIDNPFIENRRMYKSGDLARFLDDGRIEYVGRADCLVKIRGYRIELGEIEKYLGLHEAVKDAVVVDCEENGRNKFLCAYIVSENGNISFSEMKDYLLRFLPDYMIPLYFVTIDSIPLTSNGKVDRALLPAPQFESDESYEPIPYRNEKEKKLVAAICKVLNCESISIKHNFYRLGGDSIKAIQVASIMNNNGFRLKVKDILSHPIIEEMAYYIEQIEICTAVQELCKGSLKHSPIVSWFFLQNFANKNHYTQSVLLELNEDVETEKLNIVLNELIKHHDSLRINYKLETRELFYNNKHLKKNYSVDEYDLSDYPYLDQCCNISALGEKLKASFNIDRDIMIKACVFNLGKRGKRLLVCAHHLVIDGVSWRIILEDISTIIRQINNGQEITLPAKTDSFQKWAETLNKYDFSGTNEEKRYWESVLEKKFNFPIDYDLGEDVIEKCNTVSTLISEDQTEKFLTQANLSYNTKPKDLIISALVKTIYEHAVNGEIVIELEGHGREDIFPQVDNTRTVGWFTSLYPFYIEVKDGSLANMIKHVKEELRRVPNNGIDFGILKYIAGVLDNNNPRYIRLNYLGDFSRGFENSPVKLLNGNCGSDVGRDNHLTCLMEINCMIVDKKLNIMLTYSRNKFSENTIQRFINKFNYNFIEIINHCCEQEATEFTPSDFDTAVLSQNELDSLFE